MLRKKAFRSEPNKIFRIPEITKNDLPMAPTPCIRWGEKRFRAPGPLRNFPSCWQIAPHCRIGFRAISQRNRIIEIALDCLSYRRATLWSPACRRPRDAAALERLALPHGEPIDTL